ncbi:flagellar basal body P-ring formation chaperone FlgA [Marinimicrobium alkaliphilum]|uniref:flagellar basal body P-ring formation chaperone FlgA n=1 Tax=Marinimicrobium alkaliphilum TaxID=2202654 RepID=UPI000DB9BD8A|nr:flagellar basal body P-ring formation chaperone FlgA [Marinimicrobium alkaliphilum]
MRIFRVFLYLWVSLLAAPATAQHADLGALHEQVTAFLHTQYMSTDAARIDVQVSNLDRRLTLPECQETPELSVNDPQQRGGNVSVHVRCAEPGWAFYVPSQVALYHPVVVAAHNLERGAQLTEADVTLEMVNTSTLRQGHLDNLESAVGRELRRPLSRGDALRSGLLDAPMLVQRGDEVVIEARSGGISVTSTGTAMANGRLGQQIRVRNSQSDRIVRGEVVAPGRVLSQL